MAPSGSAASQEASQAPHRHWQAWDAHPIQANVVWASAFDTTADPRVLVIDVAGSIRSKRIIEVSSKLVSVHGALLFMRSDNGPELISYAILEWIAQSGISTALRPWQASEERRRRELQRQSPRRVLVAQMVLVTRVAVDVNEALRRHYNAVRPHGSMNYLTPHEFK